MPAWDGAGVDRGRFAAHLSRMADTVIRVVAAVISDGERLLVCQRPLHKRHGGLWEFPGGKCEPGESDAQAAQRELGEELGVDVTRVGEAELRILDPGSIFEIAFVPVMISGEAECREHSALQWGTPAELIELPLAPSDRHFVESRLKSR